MTELDALAWCKAHEATIMYRSDGVYVYTRHSGQCFGVTFIGAVQVSMIESQHRTA